MGDKGEKTMPRIEVSHFNSSKSSSVENLIQGNEELPGGVSNPVFNVEDPSSTEQKIVQGNEELPGGVSNPVFNFEEPNSSTEPEHFCFDDESIQKIKSQPRRGTFAGGSSPQSRIYIKDGRKTAVGDVYDNTFIVPDIQHINNGIHFTSDDLGDKTSRNLDPFPSDRRLAAPPTPGLLGFNVHHPPPSPGLLSINSVWSELAKCSSRRSSYTESNESSFRSGSLSNLSSSLSEQLHSLVRAFSSRTERVKATTAVPVSPSESPIDYDGNSDALSAISNIEEPNQRTHRLDSFIPGHRPTPSGEVEENKAYVTCCILKKFSCKIPRVFEAQSKKYMSWLFLVTLTFMYNSLAVPLRAAFTSRYMNEDTYIYWLTADYVCDAIYLLDLLVFKPRVTFLTSGLNETDVKKTRKHYMQKSIFKFDMLSLLPLDIFYFVTGYYGPASLLRLPRLMKIQTFWEFYQRCDQAVRSAHILRILKTMTYMLFLIHVEACGYYAISAYEGFDANGWVYNGTGNAYIKCFYMATKTATSIGNNPKPVNTLEYVFMTLYWLSGVFVFALLVGQIRDIVEQAQRIKTMYDKRMETALRYVKNLNLPKEMREKVRVWFIYNWQQQKILDEKSLMDTLPIKLRTDLAIHVHFNTLSKVKLFQDCDKSLLFNLVLKFRPILFLPGEYVCRKGEIGKEMYIVSHGIVEVVGGPGNSMVFATLKNGSVFGEISLLAVGTEGNRRTADVRVKGFTNLFILSKADFESAMTEYPDAHKMLKKRARKLLRQNAKMTKKESESSLGGSKVNVEEIIHAPIERKTPKLLQTVLQVMNPQSDTMKKLHSTSDLNHKTSLERSHHVSSSSEPWSKQQMDKDNGQKKETEPVKDSQQKQDEKPETETKQRQRTLTAQEVEDFYDEILRATEGNPHVFDEDLIPNKKMLKRDGTANTDDSIDSGVQMNKPMSPASSTKTFSNKDSKESCITLSEEDPSAQKRHVELLAEFFEDSIHNDPVEDQMESLMERNDKDIVEKPKERPVENGDIHNATTKEPMADSKNENNDESGKPNINGELPQKNDATQTSKMNTGTNPNLTKSGQSQKKSTGEKSKNTKEVPKKSDPNKPEKAGGLLNKPGSKRPNIIGLKSTMRKITPEIQIGTDHLTKPKSGKKQMPDDVQRNVKFTDTSVRKISDVEKSDSKLGKQESKLEKQISEILEMDYKTKTFKPSIKSHRNQKEEKKINQSKNYEPRLLKIEASISNLSNEIERADALLRELCSDDEYEANVGKGRQPDVKIEKNFDDSRKVGIKNENHVEKKKETYIVPAKNQITCSVEVHREKSLTPLDLHGDILTPISLTEWIENANESLRKRKESSASSIFNETGV